jgi:hypothetical protein
MKKLTVCLLLVLCCLPVTAVAQQLKWDFLCKLKEGRRNYPGLQYCVPIGPCRVLVVGGYVGGTASSYGNPTRTCEIVNPCCEKSEYTGSMSTPRAEHVVLLTPDSNVIAIGGITVFTNDNNLIGPLSSSIELYNRSSGTWSVIGNLLYARRQAQARFINSSEILVTGGRDASLSTYDVSEIFNINTRTSRVVAPTPFAVNMHVMGTTSTGATIVAAGRNGGTNAPRTNTIWTYNRVLDTFVLAGTMTVPNRSCQILRLFDNRLLITGGVISESPYSGTDRMMMENGGSFSSVGRMRRPRWGHSMSQYSNDSVLIYGGNTEPSAILIDSCEWFIPSVNAVRPAPKLPKGIGGHAWVSVPTISVYATRLPANAVLSIGGVTGNGEMARGVPLDSIFILRACTTPDSIRMTSLSDSCKSRLLSLDSVNTCRTPSVILWNFGDGSATVVGSWSVRHSFPEFKQYTVKSTIVYPACGDSVTITRLLNVDATMSVTASPKRQAICEDETGAVLTASGAVRYEWRPAATLSSAVGATVIARPRQTTTYYVRGYSRDSCSADDSIVVEVRKRSTARITAAPLVSICKGGDSVALVLTTYTGVRNVRWTPASSVACDTCSQTKARPEVTTMFIATITDTSGCVTYDSIRIVVRSGSPARIAGAPLMSVCKGGDSLSLALTSNVGVRSVRWIPKAGVACDTCKQTKVLPSVTTTYTAVIVDADGCTTTDSVRILVGTGSKIMRASGEQFICFKNDSARISVEGKVRSVAWTPGALVSCSTCVSTTVKPTVTTTYTFLAVDSAGCTLLDSVKVTVLPKATVDIDPDTVICGSTPLRVTVFGTYQRVEWTPTSGVNCPTCPTVLLTPVPGKTLTYYVKGHNGKSADCEAVDSVRFRFAPGIEGQLSDRQMCPGDSIIVSVRRFGGVLQWTPAIKPMCDTCTTYVLKPLKTTRYVLTGDSLGCVSRDTMNVVIAPTTLRVPATMTVCSGKRTSIGAVTNADNVQWTPSTDLSCSNCPNPILTPTSTRTYVVSAGRGSCIVRDSVRVMVLPAPSFTVSPIDTTICSSRPVTIVVRPDLPGSRVVWNTTSDLNCFECDSVVAKPSSSDAWYTARITTPGGCDSAINVRIRTVAPPRFSVRTSSSRICEGEEVELKVQGDTTVRFTWITSGGAASGIACDTCVRTTARPRSSSTFIVRGIAAAGCVSVDSVRVTVEAVPQVRISADTGVCAGERIALSVSGGDVVRWEANPALSCTDCAQPLALITSTTVFRVRVSSASAPSCGRDTSVTITALPCVRKVTVNSAPIPGFNACDSALATIIIRNDGNKEMILDSVQVRNTDGAIIPVRELQSANAGMPRSMPTSGDTLRLAFHLVPQRVGDSWVDLRLFFRDSACVVRLEFQSTAERLFIQLPSIMDVHPDTLITLNCSVSGMHGKSPGVKDSVLVHVYVDPASLHYEAYSRGADLPADWTCAYDAGRSSSGHAVFILRGSSVIANNGEWLRPQFRTLVPKSAQTMTRAEVEFVSLRLPCVEAQSVASMLNFSSCVLDLRQIEWSSTRAGLYEIRPNPVQGTGMTIRYGISFRSETEMSVFTADGREMLRPLSGSQSPGVYEVDVSVTGLPAGQYFVRLRTMGEITSQPFVIAR